VNSTAINVRRGGWTELRKLVAFFRRDALVSSSYRFGVLSDIASVGLGVFTFWVVSRMVDPDVLPEIGGRRPTFMEFAAVGIVLGAFIQLALVRVSRALADEQLRGTFEPLVLTPTNPSTLLFGSIVYDLVQVPLRAALFLTVLVAALGLDYSVSGIPAAAIVLLLFLPFVWGLALVNAALTLTFRRGAGFFAIFVTLFTVGSGAYFPLAALPESASTIAPYNPIWIASHGMREALIGGGWDAVDSRLLVLLGLATPALLLGSLAFSLAARRERRFGSLGSY
jgi:ABC-2 type transport system permease protein